MTRRYSRFQLDLSHFVHETHRSSHCPNLSHLKDEQVASAKHQNKGAHRNAQDRPLPGVSEWGLWNRPGVTLSRWLSSKRWVKGCGEG